MQPKPPSQQKTIANCIWRKLPALVHKNETWGDKKAFWYRAVFICLMWLWQIRLHGFGIICPGRSQREALLFSSSASCFFLSATVSKPHNVTALFFYFNASVLGRKRHSLGWFLYPCEELPGLKNVTRAINNWLSSKWVKFQFWMSSLFNVWPMAGRLWSSWPRPSLVHITVTLPCQFFYWTTAASENIQSRRNGQSEKMYFFLTYFLLKRHHLFIYLWTVTGSYSDQLNAAHKLMTWHIITELESIKNDNLHTD